MAQFRVMTWNVENLFDVRDDDGPKTQAQFAAKIESLRAVIDAQQPPTRRHPPNHRQRGGCLRARSRARDRGEVYVLEGHHCSRPERCPLAAVELDR